MAKYIKGIPDWYSGETKDLNYQKPVKKVYDNDIQKKMYEDMENYKNNYASWQTPKLVKTPPRTIPNEPLDYTLSYNKIAEEKATPKKSGLLSTLLAPFSKENYNQTASDVLGFLRPKLQQATTQKSNSALIGAINSVGLGLPKVATEKLVGSQNTAYSQAQQNNPKSYLVGEMAGYLAPGIGATKALKPVTGALTKNIGSALGKQVIEGAIVGAGLDTTQGLIEGDNAKQLATRVGTGALLGAGADIGLNALGEYVPKAIKALDNSAFKTTVTESKIQPLNAQNKTFRINGDLVKKEGLQGLPSPRDYTQKLNELPSNNDVISMGGYKETQRPLVQIKKERIQADIPINQRDFSNVGNKEVKSIQYNHQELKPYIQQEAELLKGELLNGNQGTPYQIKDNGIISSGGRNSKVMSDSIQAIQDITGASYEKIEKAIDDLIIDGGRENNALAKKVELIIDERLSNGYDDSYLGDVIPPNIAYLNRKEMITGQPLYKNTINSGIQTNKTPVQLPNKPQESVKTNLDINSQAVQNNVPMTSKQAINAPVQTPRITHTEESISKLNSVEEIDRVINELKEQAVNSTDENFKGLIMNLQLFAEKKRMEISKFKTNTWKNAPMLQGEKVQKVIDDIEAQYEFKANEQSLDRATKELELNPDRVMQRIRNSESLKGAEDSVAAGLITNKLRLEADTTGDYSKLKEWLETVQPKVTNTAQSLQALSTWKKLTPEGALMKAQQVVGQVNREGEKLYGKKFKPVELTPEEMKLINDTMKKVEELPEGREKDIEFAKVKKAISEKIPPTLVDKVKALQRISLLLNPKTLLARNPLGNVILGGLENVKDIPGGLLDKAVSLKTGERTTLLPSLQGLATQGKGLIKGAKETLQDARLNVNTNPAAGQFELPDTQVFKKGALSKLEKATNVGLELGDRPFYTAAYDDYLRQQMKIKKVDTPTESMIEKAKAYAEERTLQNTSAFVNGFKKLQQGLNEGSTGNKDLGLGTFALPFTKTPANILDKAIDYSPIGSLKAISQLISKKEFNQKLFVDRVGRSLTGSAMIMLGYDLAKDGKLTGKANKDKDVAALEKQTGKSAYAFKVGDTYRTFDWAQPAAIPLAIGADIYNESKDRKAAVNVVSEAIKSGGTTLFSQSLLQGVQRLFGGYDLMEGIGSTVSNIPTQFVPSGLKQVAQLTDKTQRDTYDPNKNQSLLNQLKAKVPGASKTLEPKIDTLGREVKQFQGNNNLFNVLLNPGYTTKETANPAEKMVLDIYNDTGSKVQFPRVAGKSITYKADKEKSETIQLTAKEKTALQKYIGEKTSSEFNKLAKDTAFNLKNSKDKSKELQSLLTKIYNEGEEYILKGRGISEYKK